MTAPDETSEDTTAPAPEPDRFSLTAEPRTSRDLDYLKAEHGLSRTDSVNRAVRLYAFVLREIENGARLALRRDGEQVEIVHVT